MNISIDRELSGHFALGICRLCGARVQRRSESLWAELQIASRSTRDKFRGKNPAEDPRVRKFREALSALQLSAAKYPLPIEGLIRRVVKGDLLHQRNTAIDVGVLCALELRLPAEVYDADRLSGAVSLCVASETTPPPESPRDDFDRRCGILLADESGPFGSPGGGSSARTTVKKHTRELFGVIFAPSELGTDFLAEGVSRFARRLKRFNGGTIELEATVR